MKPKPRVNYVEDISSEVATIGTNTTIDEQVNQIDNMLKKHNIYGATYYSYFDELEDNCVAVITNDQTQIEIEQVSV